MPEEKKYTKHCVIIDQRENISITGVNDVISFDEEAIVAHTEMGIIVLKGTDLHVNKLNLDKGELEVDGEFLGLTYQEDNAFNKNGNSFLGRIFK